MKYIEHIKTGFVKYRKWLVLAPLLLAVSLAVSWGYSDYIHGLNESLFTYTVNDDGVSCTVTGAGGTAGVGNLGLYIPEKIDGYTVTAVADNAFRNNAKVKNLTLPKTVVSLGSYAFAGSGLSSFILRGHVKELGEGVFSDCKKLRLLYIENGVPYIPDKFMKGCTALEAFKMGDDVAWIGDEAFAGENKLYYMILGKNVVRLGDNIYSGREKDLFAFYKGNPDEWDAVSLTDLSLSDAVLYCYSETSPKVEGYFWHYNTEGSVRAWPRYYEKVPYDSWLRYKNRINCKR